MSERCPDIQSTHRSDPTEITKKEISREVGYETKPVQESVSKPKIGGGSKFEKKGEKNPEKGPSNQE